VVTATRDRAGLARLLRKQAERAQVASDLSATIDLEAGREHWTIRLHDGRMELEPGEPEAPDARIVTNADTVEAIVRGTRSGVEAFLEGDLQVRGNLALSLRMDSMLRSHEGHPRWPKFREVRAAGMRTGYLEAGRGTPIVLLHGLGATNSSMLPTMWDLARDHRVLAPDLPGFGESDKPLRSYHATFFARWLKDFLRKTDVERAHLVGNSMGGRIAIEAGLRFPERVDRLVLLAPAAAFIKGREYVRVVRLLRPELALIPLPIRHGAVVQGIRRLFSRPSRLPAAWYDAAADEFLRVFKTPRGRISFFSAARQIYLEEPHGHRGFWDRLPSLSRPALFVWGDRDRLVPSRFAPHVERALPKATSVVFEDCGHVPQYEHAERTNRMIREFLAAA
jgi:pimeloyl-ACP methyl ester carboxylesterase/putative sterol carrier protein